MNSLVKGLIALCVIVIVLALVGWLAASLVYWQWVALFSWESFRGLLAVALLGGSGAASRR